jgi:hypothetical protein
MQLCKIGQSESKTFKFIDPYTKQDTGITLQIHPLNSKIGKKAEYNRNMKFIELKKDDNNFLDDKKTPKPEVIELIAVEFVADLVEDWKGVTNEKNKAIPFTKENLINGLKECMELTDAVLAFASDALNFQVKQENS